MQLSFHFIILLIPFSIAVVGGLAWAIFKRYPSSFSPRVALSGPFLSAFVFFVFGFIIFPSMLMTSVSIENGVFTARGGFFLFPTTTSFEVANVRFIKFSISNDGPKGARNQLVWNIYLKDGKQLTMESGDLVDFYTEEIITHLQELGVKFIPRD